MKPKSKYLSAKDHPAFCDWEDFQWIVCFCGLRTNYPGHHGAVDTDMLHIYFRKCSGLVPPVPRGDGKKWSRRKRKQYMKHCQILFHELKSPYYKRRTQQAVNAVGPSMLQKLLETIRRKKEN